MTDRDPETDANRLSSESLAAGDPTGWFERLYAASADGSAIVPWDRGSPHRLLVQWSELHAVTGHNRRALVVGCGFGDDAEYIASRGFDTVAFDIAPSAIRAAHERHPGSRVQYTVADVLALPAEWRRAYDFVFESQTVQALPLSLRRQAIGRIAACVAPAGTLLVLAAARMSEDEPLHGPPWPLSRSEIDAFAGAGLLPIMIDNIPEGSQPPTSRWRAEFRNAPPPNPRPKPGADETKPAEAG